MSAIGDTTHGASVTVRIGFTFKERKEKERAQGKKRRHDTSGGSCCRSRSARNLCACRNWLNLEGKEKERGYIRKKLAFVVMRGNFVSARIGFTLKERKEKERKGKATLVHQEKIVDVLP